MSRALSLSNALDNRFPAADRGESVESHAWNAASPPVLIFNDPPDRRNRESSNEGPVQPALRRFGLAKNRAEVAMTLK